MTQYSKKDPNSLKNVIIKNIKRIFHTTKEQGNKKLTHSLKSEKSLLVNR